MSTVDLPQNLEVYRREKVPHPLSQTIVGRYLSAGCAKLLAWCFKLLSGCFKLHTGCFKLLPQRRHFVSMARFGCLLILITLLITNFDKSVLAEAISEGDHFGRPQQ